MSKYENAEYQRAVDELVRREVQVCVSALVSTLAEGGLERTDGEGLTNLCDQAIELASPIDDYEEAFDQAGYEVRHDIHGYYACTSEEGEHEDAGNSSVGFDGRSHFENADEVMCDTIEEPYQRDVFEHWVVSDWFAGNLEAHGEKVDRDFAGLTVWARTTIGMDRVVCDIYDELHASD